MILGFATALAACSAASPGAPDAGDAASANAADDVATFADADTTPDAPRPPADPADASPADARVTPDLAPDLAPADAASDAELAPDAIPAADAAVFCGPNGLPRFGPELTADLVDSARRLPSCLDAAFVAIVPAGATWTFRFAGAPPDLEVIAYTPHLFLLLADRARWPAPLAVGAPIADARRTLSLTVQPAHSGELVLVATRTERAAALDVQVSVVCEAGCDLRATRFPVALVHGYFGTDRFFDLLDYFHDVPHRLRAAGFEVRTPTSNPFDWSENRAAQLVPQLDALLAETGARKLNLIGHSQGGLDARVLVSGLGFADRVATVTTVGTPHRGTPLLLDDLASVQDFSVEYLTDVFNPAYPDAADVRYFSWSARSCGLLDLGCQRETGGEIADALLTAFHTALTLRIGDNDGFVPTASMVWGEHLGSVAADHLDEIGQLADPSFEGDPFDHRAFYLAELDRLAAAGY
jgi:pimeloyl-ACP methyl ester carboxylesterase